MAGNRRTDRQNAFRDDGRPFTGDRAGNAREIKFSAYGELASNMPL